MMFFVPMKAYPTTFIFKYCFDVKRNIKCGRIARVEVRAHKQ